MDDTSEKARRNLMAFSLAIIAIAWLKVPLTGNLFGAVIVGDISPIRAWVAAIAVLGYLALRFHLSPHVTKPRSEWRENYIKQTIFYFYKQVDTGSRAAFSGRRHNVMVDVLEAPAEGFRLKQVIPEAIHGHSLPKTSTVQFVFERLSIVGDTSTRGEGKATLSWLNRLEIRRYALMKTLWMNWTAIEVFLPYALGTVAVLTAISKLSMHLIQRV